MSQWRYFAARVALTGPILLFALTIVFVLLRFSSGLPIFDPTEALWVQYSDFIVGTFTLQLTESQVLYPGRDVYTIVGIYAPRSLWLWFWSVLIALFVGIPLGFYAGLNPNSGSDYLASFGGILWRAMPNFWLAIILVTMLSNSQSILGFEWTAVLVRTENVVVTPKLQFLGSPLGSMTNPYEWWVSPSNGGSFFAALKKTAPAALVLASIPMGDILRLGRASMMETANAKYVEVARAKGVARRTLVWKHIARNALVPVLPIISNGIYLLIGGSVFVEYIFGIQGLGFLFFEAAHNDAVPFLSSLMFLFVLTVVGMNVFQDLLYVLIDPQAGTKQH